ncbi:MAG: DUF305 domain-containing protein [Patescibacteria group bacterium]
MQNQNTFLAGLVALLVGLILGYWLNTPDVSSNMHGAMGGMMSELEGKTGGDLEKAFLEEMIVHHEGAVVMAQTLLAGTKRPELVKLGNDIVTAQTGEIAMMKEWLKTWFK